MLRTVLPCADSASLGGISNFFSQLIVSFGFTNEQSLLYGTPGGAVEIISLIVCGFLGDRLRNRLVRDTPQWGLLETRNSFTTD
jgi:hypothetical protein